MRPLLFLIGALAVIGALVVMGTGKAEIIVVSFGDSTTAPRGKLRVYSDILQTELTQEGLSVEVINAGVGGNTTAMARTRFQGDVLRQEPDVVIVQFGINDAAVDVWKTPPANQSRVLLADYEANLRYFLAQIRESGAQPILMTPNPMGWTEKLKTMYGKAPYLPQEPDGFNIILKQYAAKVREIARDEEVPLVDIYAQMAGRVDALTLDGMHPNADGQQLVAAALLPRLQEILEQP